MSGRKRLPSSGTDSLDAAAANKKAKKQHSEAPANIPAQVDSSSTGTRGTKVTSSMSTPTTSCPSDTVNLTTTSPSINPIMTPTIFLTRSDQDMRLVNIPEESERLSAYVNAFAISLPLAEIQQNSVKHSNQINKIRSDLFGYLERTCVASIAEGLNASNTKDHCQNGLSIHGPAHSTIFFEPYDEALFPNMETNEKKNLDVDLVLCIKRSQWPRQAFEWKTRRRASNWPTRELVDLILDAGYSLAAVGSKESMESEIQWRVSFNKAEQLIIESFNETQMHCIFLLKLFNSIFLSRIAGKSITSYTMKTVMFWCLEENSDSTYWKSSNLRLRQTIHCDVRGLVKKQYKDDVIALYNRLIYDIDLVHQDPYKTTYEFEQLTENNETLIGYNSLCLAWKQSYFDVTFMQPELPILPRPVAVEFCIGIDQKHISFHPYLYGLLLEYLWHAKYGSGNREKKLVLDKMENCVLTDSMIPDEQKSVGLNFMAYCYSLQKDYQLASRCLVRSLKLNTVRKNVAYWYMFYRKYRIKRIRELSLDSQS
ncbi:unnamed protein product [Mytilus edulis]|uniref:Mab-21-like HhH/H2TH-like domain-containing protein n=1 Tax=Mytilus edulis TaxID=6550 RepID=A0A8S3UTJ0_MYTED|nr:unnamed protein product [Mytilus edulis]